VLFDIRRCGKSGLLEHVRKIRGVGNNYYLNFEDERLVNFGTKDF
jgi:predicted AAA+ superfamily ATPase